MEERERVVGARERAVREGASEVECAEERLRERMEGVEKREREVRAREEEVGEEARKLGTGREVRSLLGLLAQKYKY